MAAIYCPPWPKDLEVTTTLYPIDVTETVHLGGTLSGGVLEPIPNEDWAATFGTTSDGTLTQLRWFYEDGPYDDQWTASFETGIDRTLVQLRWYYEDGPYDDEWTASFSASDGTLVNKLVEADSPDEMLHLGCTILNTCTMDLI